MVDIKVIEYVVGKCLTISRMKTKLSLMSHEDKMDALNGRLTRLEWEDYNNIYQENQKYITKWLKNIEDGIIDKDKIPMVYEFIQEIEHDNDEELFKYERRILEDYHVQDEEPPQINENDYLFDKDIPYDLETMQDKSIIGSVEKEMIDYQQQNYNLTPKEEYWIERYYLDNYTPLKDRINQNYEALEEDFSDPYALADFEREFPSILRHMDNAISKQDGLLHPTILYHGGPVDISVPIGGHGVWKNYISATFQEISMKGHNKDKPDYWEMVIYAPTGTKGLCGNIPRNYGKDENGNIKWDDNMGMNQYLFEHEYLLGRNMGYTVIGMDYENHRQIVVLDEP